MADEIAYFEFPGIEAVESADYTRAHGRTPGVCTIKCRPQSIPPDQRGDITLVYDSRRLVFRDCIIDQGGLTFDGNGQIAEVRILDRRWKWQYPTVHGRYNVYDEAGNLDVSTDKAPRELARLCLEAMGETKYRIANIPNDTRPFVDWDSDNAAEALESLAEACGCRVVLDLNDNVSIEPVGVGASLYPDDSVERLTITVDLAEAPDRLRFIGGADVFNADLELEAVGRDTSGESIRLLDDLSYNPVEGWAKADLETTANALIDTTARELALSSVFKLYRIKMPAGGIVVPGYEKRVTSLKQLELLNVQVTTEFRNGNEVPRSPAVYGIWFDHRDTDQNNTTVLIPMTVTESTTYDKKIKYPFNFNVNEREHTVQFSDLVYRGSIDGNTISKLPATLYLRISFNIRDATTGGLVYSYKDKPTGFNNGTKPRVIRQTSVVRARYPVYGGSTSIFAVIDNRAEWESYAEEYLDTAHAEYQLKTPQTVTYAGLRFDTNLDGAIQQITWNVPGGNSHATTTIYRNNDISNVLPTYQQMRYRRRLQGGLATISKVADRVQSLAEKLKVSIFGGAR